CGLHEDARSPHGLDGPVSGVLRQCGIQSSLTRSRKRLACWLAGKSPQPRRLWLRRTPMHRISRRDVLKSTGVGFGYLAFAGLSTWAAEKSNPLAPKKSHFPAKAKHVIFLCMEGAPSHVDTFDYKPKLTADNGQSMRGARFGGKLLGSPWKFN